MINKFPLQHSNDIDYITEIIFRPFIGSINKGGKFLYKGNKGGIYFISNNTKRYIKLKV